MTKCKYFFTNNNNKLFYINYILISIYEQRY